MKYFYTLMMAFLLPYLAIAQQTVSLFGESADFQRNRIDYGNFYAERNQFWSGKFARALFVGVVG